MKKRLAAILLAVLLLLSPAAPAALADAGPKPSVVVDFRGLEGQTYYATLLSQAESTGPWSYDREMHDWQDSAIWTAFHDYQDSDGYYFLGHYQDCTDSRRFTWAYYPPQSFKLLLYFPQADRLIVSADVYERYAFDSYFTADCRELDIAGATVADGAAMAISKSYDLTWQLLSLLARLLLTVAVELLLALAFGLRARRQLRVIIITNLATQLVLNLLLNILNFSYGAFAFIAGYVLLELVVLVVEGCVYARLLPSRAAAGQRRKCRPWLYALVANFVSFAVGMLVAWWLPGVF